MTTAIVLLLLLLYGLERAHNYGLRAATRRATLAEEFLRASPSATLALDAEGSIRYFSQAAAHLFGYRPEDVLGHPVSLLIAPDTPDSQRPLLQHSLCVAAPTGGICDVEGRCRDQSRFPMQLRTRRIAHGGQDWMLVAVRDMTADVQVKAALHRHVTQLVATKQALQQHNTNLQRLIEEQTAELRIAKDAAEAANSAKSEFLANMSHELRTPLHGILSFARFGIKKNDDPDRRKLLTYFQRIEAMGQTLLRLLNDLLDLSKLEARATTLECEQVRLETLLFEIAEQLAASAREKELAVHIRASNPEILVWADKEKLGQVMRNLLGNAVKFTPTGGEINLVLEASIESAIISIQDTGPGIKDEDCERVFDKFVQSEITRTGAGGTGLGLSICREIIQLHEGKIRALPTQGRGALLEVVLPRWIPDTRRLATEAQSPAAAVA